MYYIKSDMLEKSPKAKTFNVPVAKKNFSISERGQARFMPSVAIFFFLHPRASLGRS